MIKTLLKNKTAKEQAKIKATEIAKLNFVGTYTDSIYGVRVKIQSIKDIGGGIEIMAQAWKGNKQLGFGKDGSVDIERFRIYNPPILIDELKEDTIKVIRKDLAHIIKVVGKTDGTIVKGKVGRTTSTFYPDAHIESNTVDGRVGRRSDNETMADKRAGVGTIAEDSLSTMGPVLRAGAVADTIDDLYRYIFLFNTSGLPDENTIDSATFSFVVSSKNNDMSGEASVNSVMVLVESTPQDNTSLISSDYSNLGSVDFGRSVTQENIVADNSTHNSITVNASGLDNISKTSITKFGLRVGWDFDNTIIGLTDVNDGFQGMNIKAAEAEGVLRPKLIVEHSIPIKTITGVSTIQGIQSITL